MANLTQKRILEILPKAGVPLEENKTISEIAVKLQIEDIHRIITAILKLEKRGKVEIKGQKKIFFKICGINKNASFPIYGLTV